jgi:hypothetical protein
MTKVLGLYNHKLEGIRNQDPTINNSSPEKDSARFLLMDTYRILRTSCFNPKVDEQSFFFLNVTITALVKPF